MDGVTESGVTQRRLSAEGADLLTLAGVNDANLIELARLSGTRVALRGEVLSMSGSPEAGRAGRRRRPADDRASPSTDARHVGRCSRMHGDEEAGSAAAAMAIDPSATARASSSPAFARSSSRRHRGRPRTSRAIVEQRHRHRHRTGGHGQDVSRRGRRRRCALAQARAAHRARSPGGGSWENPRLPPGRHAGQGRSLPAPAL